MPTQSSKPKSGASKKDSQEKPTKAKSAPPDAAQAHETLKTKSTSKAKSTPKKQSAPTDAPQAQDAPKMKSTSKKQSAPPSDPAPKKSSAKKQSAPQPEAAPAQASPKKKSAPRTKEPHSSPHPGMGAVPVADGTSFRVWAPNADAVFVAGSFNDWSSDKHQLGSDGDGYWSIYVEGVKPGAHYKFRVVNDDLDLWRFDPYAREVTNSVGDCVVADYSFEWGSDDYRTPPWNEMVIYELHVGTFHRTGDGPGTFDSAIEKLPYLRELGVNVIEVMPPTEFAGGISWGYNPANPFAIESDYGGPQAFKRFIKAAHEHDIAIVLDVVYNHFGPSDLDLWQFDGWSENGMGGIYFYQDWRANTPWGDTRPDYGRPEVRQYIRDNMLMWLEEYHVDGLRFDGTAYIRNVKGVLFGDELPDGWDLMRWLNSEINGRQPWKITIAEDLRNDPAVTAPVDQGGAGFDAQWDAGFVHPVRAALIVADDVQRNIGEVANAVGQSYNGDAFRRIIYTESHDEVANGKARVPEEIKPGEADSWWSQKRSTAGAALVFTAPGIPMLFQGQELLEDSWFDDNRPLDWGKQERHAGILNLYRDLVTLRRNGRGITRGLLGRGIQMGHMHLENKMLAYHRWDAGGPGDSVMVVVNLSERTWQDYGIGMPAPGVWKVRFNSDWNGYSPVFANTFSPDVVAVEGAQDNMPCRGAVSIGPYSALILSQE